VVKKIDHILQNDKNKFECGACFFLLGWAMWNKPVSFAMFDVCEQQTHFSLADFFAPDRQLRSMSCKIFDNLKILKMCLN
jgi:hypothetical protein